MTIIRIFFFFFVFFFCLSSSALLMRAFATTIYRPCEVGRYCGQNSICTNDADPPCACPTGFQPMDPSQWTDQIFSKGCGRISALQCTGPSSSSSSRSAGSNEESDGFLAMEQMRFSTEWRSTTFFRPLMVQDEETCRSICLANCSCHAFYFQRLRPSPPPPSPEDAEAEMEEEDEPNNCSLLLGGEGLYDGTHDPTAPGCYYLRLSSSSIKDVAIAARSTRNGGSHSSHCSIGLMAAILILLTSSSSFICLPLSYYPSTIA